MGSQGGRNRNSTLRYYCVICIVVNLLGILDFSGIRGHEISMFGVRGGLHTMLLNFYVI
jgi:hypothetical protein